MNWFLDMCIVIFYASDSEDIKSEKSKEFVNNKKDNKFLLCCYITKENMPKWIERQLTIIKIIGKKITNPSEDIEKTEEYQKLFKQDIMILKKFLAKISAAKNKQDYYENLRENNEIMIRRINYFLLKLVDKEVIEKEKVDFELKSTLFTFLQNNSDAITLASGIQHHNQEEELTILTGDKKDWNKDNLEWVFDSKPQLAKIYPKRPGIKYIQNM